MRFQEDRRRSFAVTLTADAVLRVVGRHHLDTGLEMQSSGEGVRTKDKAVQPRTQFRVNLDPIRKEDPKKTVESSWNEPVIKIRSRRFPGKRICTSGRKP